MWSTPRRCSAACYAVSARTASCRNTIFPQARFLLERGSDRFHCIMYGRPPLANEATRLVFRRSGLLLPHAQHLRQVPHRQREHDGVALLAGDVEEGAEVAELHRLRALGQDLAGL